MSTRLGIICGLESEARTLGGYREDARLTVAIAGANSSRAAELAHRMAQEGVRCLVSWGIAGGLDPSLFPGSLLVPGAVRSTRSDPEELYILRASLVGRGGGDGDLLGVTEVVTDPAAKSDLRDRTQARAIDMETHAIAGVADAAGIPCVAVRAISDPASRALPELATDAVDDAGRPMIGKVLAGLARRPWQTGALMRAKNDSDAAHDALRDAANALLPRLTGAGAWTDLAE